MFSYLIAHQNLYPCLQQTLFPGKLFFLSNTSLLLLRMHRLNYNYHNPIIHQPPNRYILHLVFHTANFSPKPLNYHSIINTTNTESLPMDHDNDAE